MQQLALREHSHRPKLAATLLRQEPVPGTETRITLNAVQLTASDSSDANNDITPVGASRVSDTRQEQTSRADQPSVFEISSWALVDESTLSVNVVSQFECLLTIEGTTYEQRQSLSLQRGK